MYKLHADFCKFMANEKRIEILFLLGEREMCVDEISTTMGVKLPNVSQHLAVMRDKNVVTTRKNGNKVYYSLSNPKTLEACILMRDAMIEEMEKEQKLILSTNVV